MPDLTGILDAVAVEVVEDRAADRADLLVAEVGGGGAAGRHGDRHGVAGRADVAGGVGLLDGVGACGHAGEDVGAVAGGGCGADHVAGAVEQVDGDAAEARFTGVLDAVAVEVVEDRTADRADLLVAEVGGGRAAGGHADRHAVGGRADVAAGSVSRTV